jgi:hypothetical protein
VTVFVAFSNVPVVATAITLAPAVVAVVVAVLISMIL